MSFSESFPEVPAAIRFLEIHSKKRIIMEVLMC
jgi:hypothetical protein